MRRSGANSPAGDSLADRWRAARPPVAGLHLDSAACSRQSFAALDAAAQHARHEAEVGGYVAAEAAAAVLDAGRAAVAALSGLPDAEVVFTTGSLHALDLLLGSWPGENRTLACLPGEYGPNLAVMAAHGFDVRPLPTLQDGRVALDDAAFMLADDPPDLVHLTVVASHRGVAQPLAMVAQLCTELKLPLVVDAAQGLGHVDCAVGADVTYASSRKWIAGPRGVGVLAVRPELMERLRARLPAPDWMPPLTVAQQLGFGEANVACPSRAEVYGERVKRNLRVLAASRVSTVTATASATSNITKALAGQGDSAIGRTQIRASKPVRPVRIICAALPRKRVGVPPTCGGVPPPHRFVPRKRVVPPLHRRRRRSHGSLAGHRNRGQNSVENAVGCGAFQLGFRA